MDLLFFDTTQTIHRVEVIMGDAGWCYKTNSCPS
jgi:hypothetical protein